MWSDKAIGHCFDSKSRTNDVKPSENVTFDELLLAENVLSGLKKSGFERPSPIQLKAIPLGRCGIDLVVQAKSGTGKTCVFSVISLEAVNTNTSSLQIVILAPTREIALQIHGVLTAIGRDIPNLSVQVFIGGTLVSDDRVKAKKCHIAVGSPGRVKQLIDLGVLEMKSVRLFVLDEADKLMEEGCFQTQINWIYSTLPTNKQMIALSATYPEVLADFLTRYMREPTFVRLNPSDPALLGLQQYYILLDVSGLPHLIFEAKTQKIIDLLSTLSFQQALVFSNYHSRAASLSEALNSGGWPSTFISGNMEQEKRIEAINQLKEFKCRVLISTDLTSRGIDAHNVDLVINMDVPMEWETYMHRIGRAGRFGSRGIAISLSTKEESADLYKIFSECNTTVIPFSEYKKVKNQPEIHGSFEQNDLTTKPDDEPLIETPGKIENQVPAINDKIEDLPNTSIQEKDSNLNGHILNGGDSVLNVETGDLITSIQKMVIEAKNNNVGSAISKIATNVYKTVDHKGGALNSVAVDTTLENRNQPNNDGYPVVSSNKPITRQSCLDNSSSLNKNSNLPLIPSLDEVVNIGGRQNKHYLHMNYNQLEADYNHYLKTGQFMKPDVTKIEKHHKNVSISRNDPGKNIFPNFANQDLANFETKSADQILNTISKAQKQPKRPIIAKKMFHKILSEVSEENTVFLNTKMPKNAVKEFPFKVNQSLSLDGSGDHGCSLSSSNSFKETITNSDKNKAKSLAISLPSKYESKNIYADLKNVKNETTATVNMPSSVYTPSNNSIAHNSKNKSSFVPIQSPTSVNQDYESSIEDESDSSCSSSNSSRYMTSSDSDSDITDHEGLNSFPNYPSYCNFYHQNYYNLPHNSHNYYDPYERWKAYQAVQSERIYSENLRRWVTQYANFITH